MNSTAPALSQAAAGHRQPRDRRKLADNVAGWSFAGPASLIILGFSLIPMVWALALSFTDSDLQSPGQNVGLANYRALVADPVFFQALRNTGLLVVLYIPASLIAGLLVAVLLNRKVRGIGFYRTCFLVPYIASATSAGLLMGYIFDRDFGMMNGLLVKLGLPMQGLLSSPSQAMYVLTLIFFWTRFGFAVVIYLAAIQEINKEILEAASIDGASRWTTFRHIIVPSVRPMTVFLTVWGVIDALQFFDLVMTTTKGGPANATVTIVYYIWQLAFTYFTAGYGAAVAYVLFVGTLVLIVAGFLIARRKGVMA
ncbi:carbohydrate ABC transporter permease [Nonomuraea sp. NEAU-A123]|uniref:carbohydrate ABC transporter permease n=1 Tax=Nonomuraea sp. NEAU-A123 TaxID=2839649 RepID=UPI001BE48C6F|nr:sugar ABC transporter permease [Nonomuraea sp. NEAU-A123]MBT2234548.1 sugar ABC transporter permease [Nonomuraea sp. NEAU-A123]